MEPDFTNPFSVSNKAIGNNKISVARRSAADTPFCVTFPGFWVSQYVTPAGRNIDRTVPPQKWSRVQFIDF